jgi:DNA-binding transcriptional regulator YiaG
MAEELVEEVAHDGADVNALCETYQLKREELGRLTGFSLRALAEWAAGKLPSQPAQRRLQEVRRLLDALAQIVKRESIPR